MRKNVTKIRLIILIIVTLVTGIVWIGGEIYSTYTADLLTPELKKDIEPLNPRLYIQALDKLEQKNGLENNPDIPSPSTDLFKTLP